MTRGFRLCCLVSGVLVLAGGAAASSLPLIGPNFESGRPLPGDTLEQAVIPCDPAYKGKDCTALGDLENTLAVLRRYPTIVVHITGHTDIEECVDGEACARLGAARATMVYEYLLQNGIDPARIVSVIGYGNNYSIAEGSGGLLLADRRVEISQTEVGQRPRDAIAAAYEALEAELRRADASATDKPLSWQYRIELKEFADRFVVTFTPRAAGEGGDGRVYRFEVPQNGGEVVALDGPPRPE